MWLNTLYYWKSCDYILYCWKSCDFYKLYYWKSLGHPKPTMVCNRQLVQFLSLVSRVLWARRVHRDIMSWHHRKEKREDNWTIFTISLSSLFTSTLFNVMSLPLGTWNTIFPSFVAIKFFSVGGTDQKHLVPSIYVQLFPSKKKMYSFYMFPGDMIKTQSVKARKFLRRVRPHLLSNLNIHDALKPLHFRSVLFVEVETSPNWSGSQLLNSKSHRWTVRK